MSEKPRKPQKPNLKLSPSVKVMVFRKKSSNLSCRSRRPPSAAVENINTAEQLVHNKKETIPLQGTSDSHRKDPVPSLSTKTTKSEVLPGLNTRTKRTFEKFLTIFDSKK
uniref:Uncharacterized protein n=1 Tax=Homalodisca liturata TaxID=320908 RepID=A0A1B6IZD2_9HEMI